MRCKYIYYSDDRIDNVVYYLIKRKTISLQIEKRKDPFAHHHSVAYDEKTNQ